MSDISCEKFLAAARRLLSERRYEEIVGELWLRWPHVEQRLAAGKPLDIVVREEIRRACTYLKSAANRVRPGARSRVVPMDPDKLDRVSYREKW